MSWFPQLPLELRERIVTKLEWKSYFRMQQTCKDMEEFIRTNRNVKVFLPAKFHLEISVNDPNGTKYYTNFRRSGKFANLECLYGVRFNVAIFDGLFGPARKNLLPDCFVTLKKYRITASGVDTSRLNDYSNGEYNELLAILKPVRVKLGPSELYRLEMLLAKEELKSMSITFDSSIEIGDMPSLSIVEEFLEKCQHLEVSVCSIESEELYAEVDAILKYFRSHPLPNLRSFVLRGPYESSLPRPDFLEKKFQAFNPVLNKQHPRQHAQGPKYEFKCHLELGDHSCELHFGDRPTSGQFESYLEMIFLQSDLEHPWRFWQ